MADHCVPCHAKTVAPLSPAVVSAGQELERLTAEYPAFRFSIEDLGLHGECWVAERADRAVGGLSILITRDLAEFRAVLDQSPSPPSRTHHQDRGPVTTQTGPARPAASSTASIGGPLPPDMRARLRRLQSLADAIAYRSARAIAYCPDCVLAPNGSRCDDHARDQQLITEYQYDAAAVIAATQPTA